MSNAKQGAQAAARAKLRNSTAVFLVGHIEPTMEWYKRLGFNSKYYPPGFAILSRDEIQMAALEREASQDSSRIARERREDGLYNRSYNDSSKW